MGNQQPTQPDQKENKAPDEKNRQDDSPAPGQQGKEPGELHKPGQGTR